MMKVAQEVTTQVIPSISTEESDSVSTGEMRQTDIISEIVPNTKTDKSSLFVGQLNFRKEIIPVINKNTLNLEDECEENQDNIEGEIAPPEIKLFPAREQDKEMFHSASEVLPNIKSEVVVPETEGDSILTQASIETVWIKQEAKDENETLYDESNEDNSDPRIFCTNNIWDANTSGSTEDAEIPSLDNKQRKGRRKKTSSKHTELVPHNKDAPIYNLDSKAEDLNILSSSQPSLLCKTDLCKNISQTTRVKSYVCPVCKKSFFRGAFLYRHMELHEEDQIFFCDTCGKQLKSKEALKRHIYAHSSEEVLDSTVSNNAPMETHSCNLCMKSFYRSYHLKRHMLVHSNERPYSCEICGRGFKDQHHIKAHYNIHIAQGTDFGKLSISNETLKEHLSTHNSKAILSKIISNCKRRRSHHCNKCTKSFDRRSRLKKHMFVHTDKRLHSCETCGKEFKSQAHLDLHCSIHTDENPYNLFL